MNKEETSTVIVTMISEKESSPMVRKFKDSSFVVINGHITVKQKGNGETREVVGSFPASLFVAYKEEALIG